MIYIIFLLIYNVAVIVILSATKSSNVSDMFMKKFSTVLMLVNSEASVEDIDIDKHHPIFIKKDGILGEVYEKK